MKPANQTTVREAIDAFFLRHGIDRASYLDRRFVVTLGPLRIPFPNPGYLPLHDLHHVAIDVPPTFGARSR